MSNREEREIVIERILDAPRELVWEAWTQPEHLIKWWGPNGFTNTFKQFEFKVGGIWDFTMHGPDGTDYPNYIVFTEIVKPEKLAFNHGEDESKPDSFKAVVEMKELDGKTRVILKSLFPTVEARANAVEKYGAIEGGKQTLGRLAEQLKKM